MFANRNPCKQCFFLGIRFNHNAKVKAIPKLIIIIIIMTNEILFTSLLKEMTSLQLHK